MGDDSARDLGLSPAARRRRCVQAAVEQGLLGRGALDDAASLEDKPVALVYDLDAWDSNVVELQRAFSGAHFVHCAAVKTNPVAWFLRHGRALGLGAECASLSEVMHALQQGFAAERVVYDSPCKTVAELKFALGAGVHVNVDSLDELERVRSVLAANGGRHGTVGLRINPLVGAGSIAAFSVSTGKSKFGVPLPAAGAERAAVVSALLGCAWVSAVHVHTGSGGMGLEQLVAGVRTAVELAREVNALAPGRIRVLDIGGGLAVDFGAEEPRAGFAAYAAALREAEPQLFDGSLFEHVLTEFGAALQCKMALLAARVEYVKQYDGGRIALIHAGSDLFMRQCYCPDVFVKHRVFCFDAAGCEKRGGPLVPTDIAGPLCFAGDVVVRGALVPELNVDDVVVLADVGGNSLSIRTTHCSRQAPKVFGFRILSGGQVYFDKLLKDHTLEDTLRPWQ
jgi:diaminopimelate decarboxylase